MAGDLFGGMTSMLPANWLNTQQTSPYAQYQNADGSYKPGYEWMVSAGGGGSSLHGSGVNDGGYAGAGGAPAPAGFDAFMDPSNRNGHADASFINDLSGQYAKQLGRMPSAQDQLYYEGLFQGGADPNTIFGDIGKSAEAQQFGASGAANPFADYLSVRGSGLPTPASSGGGGGGYGMPTNPYMGGQADAITHQSQDFLNHNLNGIRSNSIATGGYGGSRQGVAEGEAIGSAASGLSGALAGLYGGNWNQDQNRGLQQYGMDQNFYGQQRSLDQSGARLGADLYGLGTTGQWGPLQAANSVYAPYGGNGTTTTGGTTGGGAMGLLGGALGAAQFGRNIGLWGT